MIQKSSIIGAASLVLGTPDVTFVTPGGIVNFQKGALIAQLTVGGGFFSLDEAVNYAPGGSTVAALDAIIAALTAGPPYPTIDPPGSALVEVQLTSILGVTTPPYFVVIEAVPTELIPPSELVGTVIEGRLTPGTLYTYFVTKPDGTAFSGTDLEGFVITVTVSSLEQP